MTVDTVLKGVEQAFFGGQPGDEVQVGFAGLDAVFTGLVVVAEALLEVVQAMGLEHGVEDVRHRLLLENPPVGAQPGAGQCGFDHGTVAGAAKAGVALR